MLYTRKGDKGTMGTFGCDQRISKSSAIAEALGALDETNSFLGLCKIKAEKEKLTLPSGVSFAQLIHGIQENLFVVQAEIGGSKMSITHEKVKEIEEVIDAIEKELPPIKSFLISGGTKLAALFDTVRTITRRAERRVIEVAESKTRKKFLKKEKIGEHTLAYLNRLSSLFYALARFTNHKSGIKEEGPRYE
ncbi:cob(I)yrinic acid a,c-diamide adenosyltransferase [Patescibacteria group bacterium]|nr:cob(I)yrinic acid a,c-diamide adenosyltransferase [Patescibacteria group bacterium]MBU1728127.1 cob(I)yrinic acid a,c-diamide adenosyltransferase [Patescibacteria group bacterium]